MTRRLNIPAGLQLQQLTVPDRRTRCTRIPWPDFPPSLRADLDSYCNWCSGNDPFAADARATPLKASSVKQIEGHVHRAASALAESGKAISSICLLKDLVTSDAMPRILRQCHQAVGKKPTTFNRSMAHSLVQIARDYVKVDPATLTELRRLANRMPAPAMEMTAKNKRLLLQFDDDTMERLRRLPSRLWKEAKNHPRKSQRTLTKLQAAIAIAVLYLPLRRKNLTELTFDVHVYLQPGPGGISRLEIPADEVKNHQELRFKIPKYIADMLTEYRDTAAFGLLRDKPSRIFVHPDGSPKLEVSISALIKRYLARHGGIAANAHLFRHLAAKVILDDMPGAHEVVRQLLGHRSIQSTRIYAGYDTSRAGTHIQSLLDKIFDKRKLPASRRKAPPAPPAPGA